MASVGEQDEASRKKRESQQKKVTVFTLLMGFLVAFGALGGLFAGYILNGGSLYNDPLLPVGLSVGGLALSLVAVDRLTKNLLAKWIA